MVALASDTWRGVRICPLIPLIVSECPGNIVREISELATWFEKIYSSNPQGLRETWHCLVKAMEECSTGSTTLENMDNYKVVLPGNLATRNLDVTVTFCSHSSRPVTFKGLSKDHYRELLSLLLGCIYEKFRACLCPEAYFERADEIKILSEDNEQKVMLVGASNLRHSLPHFAGTGACVIDHTIPGWTPSPENVAGMVKNIETEPGARLAVIFDLLGNSSLRFEQFDGTTALPFKVNGRFHYGGRVVITPPDIFQKTVENILPVLRKKGDNPGVIIPPLPRGLFSRCCNDSSHCTNADNDSFAADLLTGFIGLRNNLIKLLVSSGLTNFKVLDSCCVTNCATTANLPERLEGLQKVTLGDGTHFSRDGYSNLARRAFDCIGRMTAKPKHADKKKTYFWRGFRSTTGAQTVRDAAGNQAATRGASRGRMRGGNSAAHRGHRGGFHPYRRW